MEEMEKELLEKYQTLSKKYEELKEEIHIRTLENEKAIIELNNIEKEYQVIIDKLKELV